MLRTVKSLPSLRLFAQQQAQQVEHVTRAAAHAELTTGTLFQTESVRHVHVTTKKATVLLDSHNSSKYTTMNLQGLKGECRKRGLKVSGKKIELIQRLSQSDASPVEGARSLNTAAKTLSKPIPPFASEKPSKIAQDLIKGAARKQNDLKLQEEIKKQLQTRIAVEKKEADVRAKEAAKAAAAKRAKEMERQAREERAREEVRLQTERMREKERLASEQRAQELALAQKRASEAAELVKARAQQKEQLQRELVKSAAKQQQASQIKTAVLLNAEAKSQIVQQAREQLRQRAQQEREQSRGNQKAKSELTFRDKAFFAGFGLTSATWWAYGSS